MSIDVKSEQDRIGLLSRREAELLLLGLSPEPLHPPIAAMTPATGDIPAELPVVTWRDGVVLTDWLCACPARARLAVDFSRVLGSAEAADEAEDAAAVLAAMQPLDPALIVDRSYPDFAPAIDLRAMAGGEDGVTALYCTVLDNERQRLVRLSHGSVGEGVLARVFVNGESLAHGTFIRLEPGRHVLVMETTSGRTHYPWQWTGRRVAPRFDEVSEQDVEALHRWRHGQWQRTLEAARSDERALAAQVDIDPSTVIGQEGFIRAGRSVNGVWWLLDADGVPFHYRSMCSVNNRGGTGGRRKGDPLLSDDKVEHWLGIIRQWGFNGLGSWCTKEFFNRGLVFTENIETFYEGPYLGGREYGKGVMPDVFDPRWAQRVDRKCRRLCAPLRESRQLLGYFIENERGFGRTRRPEGIDGPVYTVGDVPEQRRVVVAAEPVENPEKLGLLQYVLSLAPSEPGAARGWQFIDERYGQDIAALSAAWGVKLDSRLSLNEVTVNGERLISDAYLRDEEEFIRIWVRQFFKVSVEAIRRHDPNHLIIGMRWAGVPDMLVLEEEATWTDIISMNRYRAEIVELFDIYYRRFEKPIVMGEFEPDNDSFRYVRDAIEPPGGYDSDEQRQRLKAATAIDRVSAHPGIVGYTYYAWKNGTRHPEQMQAIQQANFRSTAVRLERDRRRAEDPTACNPLHGQLHAVVNLGGTMLPLGFVVEDGRLDPQVHGNGLTGRITHSRQREGVLHIDLEYERIPGMFTLDEGRGHLSLKLHHTSPRELEGTATGQFEGRPIDATVMAYLRRPVANPKL